MHCSRRLIVQSLVFSRSYLHRQVFPPETPVVKGGMADEFCLKIPDFHVTFRDLLHAVNLPHGRCAEDFFALKYPMASAVFGPVNLGTKGQHATSRLPKPLIHQIKKWWCRGTKFICLFLYTIFFSVFGPYIVENM